MHIEVRDCLDILRYDIPVAKKFLSQLYGYMLHYLAFIKDSGFTPSNLYLYVHMLYILPLEQMGPVFGELVSPAHNTDFKFTFSFLFPFLFWYHSPGKGFQALKII